MAKNYTGCRIDRQKRQDLLILCPKQCAHHKHGNHTFKRIAEQRDRSCFRSQRPKHIRGSGISASAFADINSMHFPIDIARSETVQTHIRWQYKSNVPFYSSILPILALTDNELQRSSLKSERIADLVFQISCIGEMHQLLVVDKNNKCRRLHRYLCHIVEIFSRFPLSDGGCCSGHRLCHDLVEHTGLHAQRLILQAPYRSSQTALDSTLSGLPPK